MYRSIRPYVNDLGLDHPVICYQGAVVADPTTDEFLLHEPIDLDLAREAIAAVEAHDFSLNCYVDDVLYVGELSSESERYAGFQHLTVHPVGNLLDWLASPPTKLVAIGEPGLVDGLEVSMKAHFGNRLFISKSLPYFLEFASPNVSKGSGLAFVAERLGFQLELTIAFGDGENDVELLEAAGYAVAVENAHPRVRELADYVCGPAHEEGVAAVLEGLLAESP